MSIKKQTLFLEIFTEKIPYSSYSHKDDYLHKLNQEVPIDIHEKYIQHTPYRLIIFLEFVQKEQIIKGPKTSCEQYVLDQFLNKHNARSEALQKSYHDKKEIWYLSHVLPLDKVIEKIVNIVLDASRPENMSWGVKQIWQRPIRNVCLLINQKKHEMYLKNLQCHTNNQTFISLYREQKITVTSFQNYKMQLLDHGILIDYNDRHAYVKNQISKLQQNQNTPHTEEINDFCNRATSSSEKPIILKGSFEINEEIQKLPEEIINIATKQDYQVYYGENSFLFCIEGSSSKLGENIIRGFQRALSSRINEIYKLWIQDISKDERYYRDQLASKMIFKNKLGSELERGIRIGEIMQEISLNSEKYFLNPNEKICMPYPVDFKDIELSEVGSTMQLAAEFDNIELLLGSELMKHYEKYEMGKFLYASYRFMKNRDVEENNIYYVFTLTRCLDILVGLIGIGIKATGSSDQFGMKNIAEIVNKINIKARMNIKSLVQFIIGLYNKHNIALHSGTATTITNFLNNRIISDLKNTSQNWKYISKECIESGKAFSIIRQLDLHSDAIEKIKKQYKRLNGILNMVKTSGHEYLSNQILQTLDDTNSIQIESIENILLCLDKITTLLDTIIINQLTKEHQNLLLEIFKNCIQKIDKLLTL